MGAVLMATAELDTVPQSGQSSQNGLWRATRAASARFTRPSAGQPSAIGGGHGGNRAFLQVSFVPSPLRRETLRPLHGLQHRDGQAQAGLVLGGGVILPLGIRDAAIDAPRHP